MRPREVAGRHAVNLLALPFSGRVQSSLGGSIYGRIAASQFCPEVSANCRAPQQACFSTKVAAAVDNGRAVRRTEATLRISAIPAVISELVAGGMVPQAAHAVIGTLCAHCPEAKTTAETLGLFYTGHAAAGVISASELDPEQLRQVDSAVRTVLSSCCEIGAWVPGLQLVTVYALFLDAVARRRSPAESGVSNRGLLRPLAGAAFSQVQFYVSQARASASRAAAAPARDDATAVAEAPSACCPGIADSSVHAHAGRFSRLDGLSPSVLSTSTSSLQRELGLLTGTTESGRKPPDAVDCSAHFLPIAAPLAHALLKEGQRSSDVLHVGHSGHSGSHRPGTGTGAGSGPVTGTGPGAGTGTGGDNLAAGLGLSEERRIKAAGEHVMSTTAGGASPSRPPRRYVLLQLGRGGVNSPGLLPLLSADTLIRILMHLGLAPLPDWHRDRGLLAHYAHCPASAAVVKKLRVEQLSQKQQQQQRPLSRHSAAATESGIDELSVLDMRAADDIDFDGAVDSAKRAISAVQPLIHAGMFGIRGLVPPVQVAAEYASPSTDTMRVGGIVTPAASLHAEFLTLAEAVSPIDLATVLNSDPEGSRESAGVLEGTMESASAAHVGRLITRELHPAACSATLHQSLMLAHFVIQQLLSCSAAREARSEAFNPHLRAFRSAAHQILLVCLTSASAAASLPSSPVVDASASAPSAAFPAVAALRLLASLGPAQRISHIRMDAAGRASSARVADPADGLRAQLEATDYASEVGKGEENASDSSLAHRNTLWLMPGHLLACQQLLCRVGLPHLAVELFERCYAEGHPALADRDSGSSDVAHDHDNAHADAHVQEQVHAQAKLACRLDPCRPTDTLGVCIPAQRARSIGVPFLRLRADRRDMHTHLSLALQGHDSSSGGSVAHSVAGASASVSRDAPPLEQAARAVHFAVIASALRAYAAVQKDRNGWRAPAQALPAAIAVYADRASAHATASAFALAPASTTIAHADGDGHVDSLDSFESVDDPISISLTHAHMQSRDGGFDTHAMRHHRHHHHMPVVGRRSAAVAARQVFSLRARFDGSSLRSPITIDAPAASAQAQALAHASGHLGRASPFGLTLQEAARLASLPARIASRASRLLRAVERSGGSSGASAAEVTAAAAHLLATLPVESSPGAASAPAPALAGSTAAAAASAGRHLVATPPLSVSAAQSASALLQAQLQASLAAPSAILQAVSRAAGSGAVIPQSTLTTLLRSLLRSALHARSRQLLITAPAAGGAACAAVEAAIGGEGSGDGGSEAGGVFIQPSARLFADGPLHGPPSASSPAMRITAGVLAVVAPDSNRKPDVSCRKDSRRSVRDVDSAESFLPSPSPSGRVDASTSASTETTPMHLLDSVSQGLLAAAGWSKVPSHEASRAWSRYLVAVGSSFAGHANGGRASPPSDVGSGGDTAVLGLQLPAWLQPGAALLRVVEGSSSGPASTEAAVLQQNHREAWTGPSDVWLPLEVAAFRTEASASAASAASAAARVRIPADALALLYVARALSLAGDVNSAASVVAAVWLSYAMQTQTQVLVQQGVEAAAAGAAGEAADAEASMRAMRAMRAGTEGWSAHLRRLEEQRGPSKLRLSPLVGSDGVAEHELLQRRDRDGKASGSPELKGVTPSLPLSQSPQLPLSRVFSQLLGMLVELRGALLAYDAMLALLFPAQALAPTRKPSHSSTSTPSQDLVRQRAEMPVHAHLQPSGSYEGRYEGRYEGGAQTQQWRADSHESPVSPVSPSIDAESIPAVSESAMASMTEAMSQHAVLESGQQLGDSSGFETLISRRDLDSGCIYEALKLCAGAVACGKRPAALAVALALVSHVGRADKAQRSEYATRGVSGDVPHDHNHDHDSEHGHEHEQGRHHDAAVSYHTSSFSSGFSSSSIGNGRGRGLETVPTQTSRRLPLRKPLPLPIAPWSFAILSAAASALYAALPASLALALKAADAADAADSIGRRATEVPLAVASSHEDRAALLPYERLAKHARATLAGALKSGVSPGPSAARPLLAVLLAMPTPVSTPLSLLSHEREIKGGPPPGAVHQVATAAAAVFGAATASGRDAPAVACLDQSAATVQGQGQGVDGEEQQPWTDVGTDGDTKTDAAAAREAAHVLLWAKPRDAFGPGTESMRWAALPRLRSTAGAELLLAAAAGAGEDAPVPPRQLLSAVGELAARVAVKYHRSTNESHVTFMERQLALQAAMAAWYSDRAHMAVGSSRQRHPPPQALLHVATRLWRVERCLAALLRAVHKPAASQVLLSHLVPPQGARLGTADDSAPVGAETAEQYSANAYAVVVARSFADFDAAVAEALIPLELWDPKRRSIVRRRLLRCEPSQLPSDSTAARLSETARIEQLR